MAKGRVACIDYGLARIGVALSDETKMIVSFQKVVPAGKTAALSVKNLASYLKEYTLDTVIIGMPLHMNGKKGFLADEVLHFIELLKKDFSCPILTWDERLSTVQAERSLKEGNMNRKNRAKVIDAVTATILLQSYLDSLSIKATQLINAG